MQLNTAADFTIMPQDIGNNIPKLCVEPCDKVRKYYSNNNTEVVWFAKVNVEYGEQNVKDFPLTIVKGPEQALLGVD